MMTEADIERVASAVAAKLINARLTELQAVREAALEEGRLAGEKAERERIRVHNESTLAEIEALARHIERRGVADDALPPSPAQMRIWAVRLRVEIGRLAPPREA